MGGDNVNVCVRFRPNKEAERNWDITDRTIAEKGAKLAWEFATVFDTEINNQSLYNTVCSSIVQNILDGFNGTIMAYGQTATGKTHTIHGYDGKERGVVPLALESIFKAVARQRDRMFLLRVSYIEIYNEEVHDLLADSAHKKRSKLPIREKKGAFHVPGMKEQVVTNLAETLRILQKGNHNRRVGVNDVHAQSSRSHSIFRLVLESTPRDGEAKSQDKNAIRVSELNLVDLAGSEFSKYDNSDKQKSEAGHINLSLSQLKSVITALSNRAKFIPYRNSSLTKILRNSLGGNARTVLICCVSPLPKHSKETKSTLNFGSLAKKVQNKARINEYTGPNSGRKALLQQYKQRVLTLEHQLKDYTQLQEEKRQIQEEYMKLKAHVEDITKRELQHKELVSEANLISTMVVHWDEPGNAETPRLARQASLTAVMTNDGVIDTGHVTPGGPDEDFDDDASMYSSASLSSNAGAFLGVSEEAMFRLAAEMSQLSASKHSLEVKLEKQQKKEWKRKQILEMGRRTDWFSQFQEALNMPDSSDEEKQLKLQKLTLVSDEFLAVSKLQSKRFRLLNKSTEQRNKHGQSLLWVAASNGQDHAVRALMDAGANPNSVDKYGVSPLWIATFHGQLTTMKTLLGPAANLETKNMDGQTPLWIAASSGQLEAVQFLVKSKAIVDSKDHVGQTPLWAAAQNDHADVMEYLLKHKANPSTSDDDGQAPLFGAIQSASLDATKLLLNARAQINDRDSDGQTCLHLAATAFSADLLAALIKHAKDIGVPINLDVEDDEGYTPLAALCVSDEEDVSDEVIETLDLLVRSGADLDGLKAHWGEVRADVRQWFLDKSVHIMAERARKRWLKTQKQRLAVPQRKRRQLTVGLGFGVADTVADFLTDRRREQVRKLIEMGFDGDKATIAVEQCLYDEEAATEYLIHHGDLVDQEIERQKKMAYG